MHTLSISKFFSFNLETNINDFINFWSTYNNDDFEESREKKIDYFTELNLNNELTENNVKKLLRWKDPHYLTELTNKKNSRVERVLSKIAILNKFRFGKITEHEFDSNCNIFPTGDGVWNIFLKHIAKPTDFPIYDQHVHRAFCFHTTDINNKDAMDKKLNDIKNCYIEYKKYFFEVYEKYDDTHNSKINIEKVKEMKKIDNALVAYGQFLQKYALEKGKNKLRNFL